MEIKKSDVKHWIMLPNLTYIELNDKTKIYNSRSRKNFLIVDKDGKRRYLRKMTKKQEMESLHFKGLVIEALGRNMKA